MQLLGSLIVGSAARTDLGRWPSTMPTSVLRRGRACRIGFTTNKRPTAGHAEEREWAYGCAGRPPFVPLDGLNKRHRSTVQNANRL